LTPRGGKGENEEKVHEILPYQYNLHPKSIKGTTLLGERGTTLDRADFLSGRE